MTFGRKTYERKPSTVMSMAVRAGLGLKPSIVSRGVMAHCADASPPIAKMDVCRHEGYRRLVALLPCKLCGIDSYSQAAHPNTGKGTGTKTDDRLCFPLCCDRPGVRGCHPQFDQHALMSKDARRAVEPAWGADTRRQITAMGLWPANLPVWEEGEPA